MIKKFKYWWAWQSEDIEQWLMKMAEQGYIFDHATWTGCVFHFRKDAPSKISYALEYRDTIDDEYRTILKADGWHTHALTPGWWIHEKQYQGKRPEIYTDNTSKIAMLKKQSTFLSTILLIISLPALGLLWIQTHRNMYLDPNLPWIILALLGTVAVFYFYLLYQLHKAIQRLKKHQDLQAR